MTDTFILTGRLLDDAKQPVAKCGLTLTADPTVFTDADDEEVYVRTPAVITNDEGYLCRAIDSRAADAPGIELICGPQYQIKSTVINSILPERTFDSPPPGTILDLASLLPPGASPPDADTYVVSVGGLAGTVTVAALVAALASRITELAQTVADALTAADVGAATADDIAAAITSLALGTAATHAASDFATPSSVSSAVSTAVAALVNSSPGTLDTLKELADALGDDPNYATTITAALAGKQPIDADLTAIAALTTTPFGRAFLTLADQAAGRTALGLGSAATQPSSAFDAAGTAAAAVTALVNGAPGILDTLKEIDDQLSSDESAAGALTALVNGIRNLTDATFLANQTASFAHKSILPAARVRCWGHSIMWGGSTQNADACTVGVNDQATLIAAHLDLPLDKQAVSGTSLFSNISSSADWKGILQYEVRPKRFAALGGVYALMYGINDMCYIGQTLAGLEPFKQALRAVVARIRCSAVFENDDASITYGGSGTWTTTAQTSNSGAGIAWNPTNGGTFTLSMPSNFPGGTIVLGFVTMNDGGGGVITGPASLGSPVIDTTTFTGTDSWRTGVLRIKNVPAGNTVIPGPNTYTFTTSGVTGAKGVIFDYWGWEPPDDQCPIVALVGQPKPIDYSSETGTPTGPGTDAGVDNVNAVQQAVAAEFGARVPYVDNSYYDKNTNAPVGHPFYVAANVHPSKDVHAGIAQNVANAITAAATVTLLPAELNDASIPTGPVGWQGYNPTLDGTGGTTLGDGTSTAFYRVDSDGTVDAYGRFALGAASVIGSTVDIPLPLAEKSGANLITQNLYVVQSGVGNYSLIGSLGNTSGKVRVWLAQRGSRTVLVGTTNTSLTITAPAGTFTSAEVGAQVSGSTIFPAGATIATVATDGSSATLSAVAGGTASNVVCTLQYKWAAPTSKTPVLWGSGSSLYFAFRYRKA